MNLKAFTISFLSMSAAASAALAQTSGSLPVSQIEQIMAIKGSIENGVLDLSIVRF